MQEIPSWNNNEVVISYTGLKTWFFLNRSYSQQKAFDAAIDFPEGVTEYQATQYIFDNYGEETTGVSMMNPGWKQPDDRKNSTFWITVSKLF